ncbi:MAG: chemotaxis-specific protein-glutamate methyltransferase CheB [Candidatus Aenigmatarchaeota archaeon]
MIKVLVVDDSSFMRKVITQMITKDPEISVVGTAENGREAVEKIKLLNPDVVTMDIIMPMSDGLWALEEIMKQSPLPVIIVSNVGEKDSEIIKEAYALGVADVVLKPSNPQEIYKISQELIHKIKTVAKFDKSHLLAYKNISRVESIKTISAKANSVVVIGSSAGAPVNLREILSKLNSNFPAGIIVAQHMPHQFLLSYVEHLRQICPLPVKIAQKGDIVKRGRILFCPGDSTIELSRTKKAVVVNLVKPQVNIQPDIDTVFASCAKVFGKNTVGVVLSGIGSSCVRGAKAIKASGGKIIAEDELTAKVYGLPQAVIKENLADFILPSYSIPKVLFDIFNSREPCEVDKEGFFVKGWILNSCAKYFLEKYGEEIIRQAVNEEFSEEKSYPAKVYLDFLQRVYDHFYSIDNEILQKLGIVELNTVGEVYNYYPFLKYISDAPHLFLNFFSNLVSFVFQGMFCEIIEFDIQKKSCSFILKNKTFEDKTVQRIIIQTTIGWIKGILKKLNFDINNLTVETEFYKEGHFIKFLVNY